MGQVFLAHNKISDFDVNYAGADILGIVMHSVGHHNVAREAENAKYGITDRLPSTKCLMDETECIKAGKAVRAIPPGQEAELYAQCRHLFGSDAQEFHKFLMGWATFLENCGGYEVN